MNAVLEEAIKVFGKDSQCKMAIEEMSELTKEICKYFRGGQNVGCIAEEIADVSIMLQQLKLIFNCEEIVSDWEKVKLGRLKRLIEKRGEKNDGR